MSLVDKSVSLVEFGGGWEGVGSLQPCNFDLRRIVYALKYAKEKK
jgi:hypothetical protein